MELMIQARTSIRYDYSYIETAALMLGSEVLEVSSFGEYAVNGVQNANLHAATVAGFPIYHTQPSKHHHVFDIVVGQGENITLSSFKDMVSVKITGPTKKHLESAVGLLGSYAGTLVDRDGNYLSEPEDLGKAWQVRPSEPLLFSTVRDPQFPAACRLPSKTIDRRVLVEAGVTVDEASVACSHLAGSLKKSCVDDVLLANDVDLAMAF